MIWQAVYYSASGFHCATILLGSACRLQHYYTNVLTSLASFPLQVHFVWLMPVSSLDMLTLQW